MVEVDASVEHTDGVTLVRATVTNTRGTPQMVRLESRLDGPIWPPRDGGFTAPEWDGDRWERGLTPGESVGLGFASPADPVEPPLEIVDVERTPPEEFRTAADVLAELDDALPPRDILGVQR